MKTKFLIIAVLVIGIGIGVGGFALSQSKSANADACGKSDSSAESHQVMIMDNKVDDPNVKAKLCDTITFTNMDNITREIAFGPHEHHVPYDGVTEKLLTQGQSLTITLNQVGSFHWHDHIHDEVEGYFTVSK
jgi:plastocyanin